MSDGGGLLRLRADHEAGRVAQEQERQPERVAQLHEPGGLVGAVGVDRAAEMGGIVRDHAQRPAVVGAGERGDDAGAEAAAQLEHVVEQGVDRPCGCRRRACGWRDQVAERRRGRARAPGLACARVEVRQVALGGRDRGRLVCDAEVDDAVRVLDVDRPDLARVEHAEPAALDHRRAAHADARVLGGDHDVAAAEQRGVAGEAVARRDPDQRDEPAEPREQVEGAAVEPGDDRPVDVAGPAAAALGEQHDRQRAGARRSRTAGPSSGGCASPACRRGRCSRRT